jgi:hypothetical protein
VYNRQRHNAVSIHQLGSFHQVKLSVLSPSISTPTIFFTLHAARRVLAVYNRQRHNAVSIHQCGLRTQGFLAISIDTRNVFSPHVTRRVLAVCGSIEHVGVTTLCPFINVGSEPSDSSPSISIDTHNISSPYVARSVIAVCCSVRSFSVTTLCPSFLAEPILAST